jgi:hypothetical protein
VYGQVGEKRTDFFRAHLSRVALVVEQDKAFRPVERTRHETKDALAFIQDLDRFER